MLKDTAYVYNSDGAIGALFTQIYPKKNETHRNKLIHS